MTARAVEASYTNLDAPGHPGTSGALGGRHFGGIWAPDLWVNAKGVRQTKPRDAERRTGGQSVLVSEARSSAKAWAREMSMVSGSARMEMRSSRWRADQFQRRRRPPAHDRRGLRSKKVDGPHLNSVGRAVELGLPMFLGILGGTLEHWARYGHAYRDAWAEVGHPAEDAGIAVAVHGFVGPDNASAKATYLEHELRMFATGSAEIGRPGMAPAGREAAMEPGGMVFAGGPNEVAERILDLHEKLGHDRQILQMDVGGMPHATFLRAIELLGTEVLPQVRKELGQ